ncbi:hypothetical protein SLS63_009970 [Diaporthe eres]|uniref:Uncharacterized protein n=1 Tax=Diaporthe eres TaxID=83184 RepID=A0ABR1NYC9_DIAER
MNIANMTSAMPQEPQWVTSLLTKRANKPLMAFEDSRKAATSTGWKARRFWEKRDTTHYAHNALQQMGVPKGHVLYDRLHKSLTEGVNLAEVTKTGLIEHLGLAQQLRSAEMQLTMDDILSIYILGEKSGELDRMLARLAEPAHSHGGTVHPVLGPAGSAGEPSAARGSADRKRRRSEPASPAPAPKKAATCKSATVAAPVLGPRDPVSACAANTTKDHGVQDTNGENDDSVSKPKVQSSIFIYDSDDSDQL